MVSVKKPFDFQVSLKSIMGSSKFLCPKWLFKEAKKVSRLTTVNNGCVIHVDYKEFLGYPTKPLDDGSGTPSPKCSISTASILYSVALVCF